MAVLTRTNGFRVLIFDLDDTLFDTTHQCIAPATQECIQALIAAGMNATADQANEERAKFQIANPRGDLFKHLVQVFGVRPGLPITHEHLLEVAHTAFHKREIKENIFVYPMVKTVLADLSSRYLIFLVTLGDPDTQAQKVRRLGIGHFFKQIFYVDSAKRQTKTEAFGRILNSVGCAPEEILSIGNRLDLEIAQSKTLGLRTCFVHTGFRHRSEPLTDDEHPDYKVERISEIIRVCRL